MIRIAVAARDGATFLAWSGITQNWVGLACQTTFVTITGQTCVLLLMRTIRPASSLELGLATSAAKGLTLRARRAAAPKGLQGKRLTSLRA